MCSTLHLKQKLPIILEGIRISMEGIQDRKISHLWPPLYIFINTLIIKLTTLQHGILCLALPSFYPGVPSKTRVSV